ncbi:hypothetical protein ACGFW5_21190 [Streptomyces sp. NPDC048416]|uniref:hypothetical protein n=1 Tax=Streptomyces sp. NPDC048416 TaxID=3365546 RepID=UPI003710CD2F
MPFEDRLGEAMRHTADGFELGDRADLVESGVTLGRRRIARRRTAVVTGSVLALGLVGFGGAYIAGAVGEGGGADSGGSVAAPPKPGGSPDAGGVHQRMVALLKSLVPPGTLDQSQGSNPEGGGSDAPVVSGVFDDGKGAGLLSLGLSRADPTGSSGTERTTCPARAFVDYDACLTEKLADGSRYLLVQGYEYPDRREPTKNWRAVLLTPKGILVEASEWNAAAEKGAGISRATPPLTAAQLRALVTDPRWISLADGLPEQADPSHGSSSHDSQPSAGAVQKEFVALLPGKRLHIGEQGAQDGYAFAVVDDGKGRSLVQINVQPRMSDVVPQGQTSTLPDGTRVGMDKKAAGKGAGVVCWTADTVRPDGLRVIVSAFNTGNQSAPATRAQPALTMDELKAIALDPHWPTIT